jgi:hypothetical protein
MLAESRVGRREIQLAGFNSSAARIGKQGALKSMKTPPDLLEP